MAEGRNFLYIILIVPQWLGVMLTYVLPYPYNAVGLGVGVTGPAIAIAFIQARAYISARGYTVGWITPTSKTGPGGWKWKGRIQIWYKQDPRKSSSWLPTYTCPDGTVGCWETTIACERGGFRHPRYNHRRRINRLVLYHKHEFHRLFEEDNGQVVFSGTVLSIPHVWWAIVDEIMPEEDRHVPRIDKNGNMFPVFWVDRASGSRTIRDTQAERKRLEMRTRAEEARRRQ